MQAGLNDDELRDEVVTLLAAGHETTATALAWTFERVLRHPHVLQRLPDDEAYLDATIKEALRVRPIIPSVGRVLAADYEVGGRLLPAGAVLIPSIALTHRREDVYPDHETFDPERFLGRTRRRPTPGCRSAAASAGAWARASRCSRCASSCARSCAARSLEADQPDDEPVNRQNITLTPGRGARVVRRR
jgi:cytochrome P450